MKHPARLLQLPSRAFQTNTSRPYLHLRTRCSISRPRAVSESSPQARITDGYVNLFGGDAQRQHLVVREENIFPQPAGRVGPDEQVSGESPRLPGRPLHCVSRGAEVAEGDVERGEPGEHRGVRAKAELAGAVRAAPLGAGEEERREGAGGEEGLVVRARRFAKRVEAAADAE
jgi:hypothetical protein